MSSVSQRLKQSDVQSASQLQSRPEFKLQKQFSTCASGPVGFLGEVSWIQLSEAHPGIISAGSPWTQEAELTPCRVEQQVLLSGTPLLGGRKSQTKDLSAIASGTPLCPQRSLDIRPSFYFLSVKKA